MSLRDVIDQRIASGPLPFSEYMELALYHQDLGYYSRAHQRSGRNGDFFTSVYVGSIFGEILAIQIDEMRNILEAQAVDIAHIDLVEAAAGNGRLSKDILDAASANHPDLYDALHLTLVERSKGARATPPAILEPHLANLDRSNTSLPSPAGETR